VVTDHATFVEGLEQNLLVFLAELGGIHRNHATQFAVESRYPAVAKRIDNASVPGLAFRLLELSTIQRELRCSIACDISVSWQTQLL
jgi:hypothetical protein